MTHKNTRAVLKIAASALALSFAPLSLPSLGAHAAECFDRNTDDPKAGNATAVVGPAVDVLSQQTDGYARPENGADMFAGDRVRTGADSHLQLKLCDWSTYTFSPDSESAISEFFDSQGAGRRRVVNFVRGGFRFASGRDTKPGSTQVKIQDTGVTMGVRGTNVLLVELDGYVYALLEGPVRDNSGLTPKGLVDFWTGENSENIGARLKRPGYAVRIGPDGVSEPFRADADLLKRIYQAFVPVVPEGDGGAIDYAGNPLGDSGQGAQEGDEYREYAENEGDRDDENTEQYPETPSEDDDEEEIIDPPVVIEVGEILPLDALEDFAAAQPGGQSGNILIFAAAQQTVTEGGNTTQNDGVALIQINVDWASRTIAPEALASFINTDFSVTDPDDLTVQSSEFNVLPDDVRKAYLSAVIASSQIPFATGDNDVSVFITPTFTFTIRQGENDTLTVDIASDYSVQSASQIDYNMTASVVDVALSPNEGGFAYFDYPLGFVATPTQIDSHSGSSDTLTGFGALIVETLNGPTMLNGFSAAQLGINFGNRTIGGGDSFLAVTAAGDPAIGGSKTTIFVALDQAVPFDSGLFGLAFYPLADLSSDDAVVKGQALVGVGEGLEGSLAAIVSDGNGNHLYSDTFLFAGSVNNPTIATIADLDSLSGQRVGAYVYDGTFDTGVGGYAQVVTTDGNYFYGTTEAMIEIDFGNRTLGGGQSYVAVDVFNSLPSYSLAFTEMLSAVSFDDAANGAGVFGFDGSDFSGSNVESMLFLIKSGQTVGVGGAADLFVQFNDGLGETGDGQIQDMPLFTAPDP